MPKVADWSKYPNFTKAEFDCKETGENEMQDELMIKIQRLRILYGKPLIVASGFRSKRHSIEKAKIQAGSHPEGLAVDFAIEKGECYTLLLLAMGLGFTGIGINQKGSGRFLHLDLIPANNTKGFLRPTIWSY